MTFTAKQFHRAYRAYVLAAQGRIKPFRQWCKTATVKADFGTPITGAGWLPRKDKR